MVDEITAGEGRDAAMNKILNTLDGVQTKGNNLTVIFTTNHPEKINSALRRPGRIDLVVSFENPNDNTKQKIYDIYFNSIKGCDTLDYGAIVQNTPNVSGSVIAEIAKRAVKLSSRKGYITTDMVISSVASIEYQVKLMSDPSAVVPVEMQLVNNIKEVFFKDIYEFVND